MKTTNNHLRVAAILSCILFLYACDPDNERFSEVVTGTATFSAKEKAREVIKLTNGRTSEQSKHQAEQTQFLTIYKGDVAVIENADPGQANEKEYELEVGQYKAVMQWNDADGRMYTDCEETFTIEAGKNTLVYMIMYNHTSYATITLENLPDATIWYGPKDFEPSDATLYPGHGVTFFPEDYNGALDIVVAFEGETKRYSTEAKSSVEYHITIVRDDDEQPEPEGPVAEEGTATFNWMLGESTHSEHTFEW